MVPSPTLDQIHSQLWSGLIAAPTNPDAGWRLPVLATTDGTQPHARTIVLRAADSTRRLLTLHTDSRSPKVAQLAANAAVSLAFYDQQSMQQVVAVGTATVHTNDDIANTNWADATRSSRRGYLAPLPPGTMTSTMETNLPEAISDRIPSERELVAGQPNFAVIVVNVSSIEWLQLNRLGNVRAVFRYDGAMVDSSWLAP